MSKSVTSTIMYDAIDNGILVGSTTPCRETKWSHWQVYRIDEKLIAVVFDGSDPICAEEIREDELSMHIDD